MSSAFLCGHAKIQPVVIENQAAYLAGWLKKIKEDKKLLITAAGAAQRSADWILGQTDGSEIPVVVSPASSLPVQASQRIERAA